MPVATLNTPATTLDPQQISAPALRTFFRIAEAWGLGIKEQLILLGRPSKSSFYRWKQAEKLALPHDTLERLSYLFGIYSALQILLPQPESADGWIRKPNSAPLFGGRSALERMLSGQVADLYLVRQYLDAQKGGWG